MKFRTNFVIKIIGALVTLLFLAIALFLFQGDHAAPEPDSGTAREDADRLGILLQPQDYSLIYRTASGTTRAAPVQLDYVSFGTLHLWNVEAAVNQSNMDVSLLGQSFLSRLSGFEVSGNILTLRP